MKYIWFYKTQKTSGRHIITHTDCSVPEVLNFFISCTACQKGLHSDEV